MKRLQPIFFLALVVLTACPQTSKKVIVRKQLDQICAQYGLIQVSDGDALNKSMEFAKFLEANKFDPDVTRALQSVATADPTQKYPLFQRFANEEQKLENWACPAMEQPF